MSAILAPSSHLSNPTSIQPILEDSVLGDNISPQSTEILVAQNFDQDILGDISDGFSNFIESGQGWALLIGVILGYMIRSVTR